MNRLIAIILLAVIASCNNAGNKENTSYKTIGIIEKYDDALDSILAPGTKAEVIAEGFEWSEGPLWLEKQQLLLFSDVPTNKVYQWSAEKGTEIYLQPSGYTGTEPSKSKEPGSNGLTLDKDGNLVLCQHGDRQVAKMKATTSTPAPQFIALAGSYKGKRFNSPNDCVYTSNGELFFTDPPYGLGTQDDTDPLKEIPFNGVYMLKKNGEVVLLVDSISRPNGLAFFPGEKKLLIANSDPAKPVWYSYDVLGDALINGKIFFDASGYDKKLVGLPDGLKINKQGIVFASGPGGLYIFNANGKKLGLIKLDSPCSNCALSPDEKTLYVTNDMHVLRINLK